MNNHFLVVVDMQNDFITGTLGSADAKKIVKKVVKKILTHCGPVIATVDTHDMEYPHTLEGKKLRVTHCVEYSGGWEIERDVATAMLMQGNYIGFVKKNTFGSLDLPEIIKKYITTNKNVEVEFTNLQGPKNGEPEFTIIGLDTDICVISNALILRAAFPNSKITIDSSCCAGTSTTNHRAALNVAKSCQIDIFNGYGKQSTDEDEDTEE